MNSNSDHENTGVHAEVLDSDKVYTLTEVCTICQIDEHGVQAFLDYGVVVHETAEELRFRQTQLDRLMRAQRLKTDLELNLAGVALALDLLDTIDELKRTIALLSR